MIYKSPCVQFVTVTIAINKASAARIPKNSNGFCIGFNSPTTVVGENREAFLFERTGCSIYFTHFLHDYYAFIIYEFHRKVNRSALFLLWNEIKQEHHATSPLYFSISYRNVLNAFPQE